MSEHDQMVRDLENAWAEIAALKAERDRLLRELDVCTADARAHLTRIATLERELSVLGRRIGVLP